MYCPISEHRFGTIISLSLNGTSSNPASLSQGSESAKKKASNAAAAAAAAQAAAAQAAAAPPVPPPSVMQGTQPIHITPGGAPATPGSVMAAHMAHLRPPFASGDFTSHLPPPIPGGPMVIEQARPNVNKRRKLTSKELGK